MRSRIHYEDFALEIRPESDGEYQVRVRAPLSGPAESFQPPFDLDGMERTMSALERTVRGNGPGEARDLRLEPGPELGPTAEEVGAALFQALFSDRVLERFLESWGHVQARPDCGLRIRLMLDPSLPGLATLCAFPWELLYRRISREFLSRNVLSPVVRYLDTQSPWLSAPPAERRLSVLVAMASPAGRRWLDLARERRRIEGAWAGRSARVTYLEHATATGLRERLRNDSFNVLHFMGHGDFDPQTGEGRLLFEDDDGEVDAVSGQVLAEICQGSRDLRLFFLNACDTARLPRYLGQDPYTGVASALVLRGAPAVVAMQFPISDQAAILFSGALYAALAAGDLIDAAVAEGRREVYLASQSPRALCGPLEWATPVLFLSAPEVAIVARRAWGALAALLVFLVLALAAAGTSPGGAAPGQVADDQRAAFSLGASLAMLGQSRQSVGSPIFEVALRRLGIPSGEVEGLCREYGEIEEAFDARRREGAKPELDAERLRRKVGAQLAILAGPEKVFWMTLGRDVFHLGLALNHWNLLDEAARAAARQDLAAIHGAAGWSGLPKRTREDLEALASRDLGLPEERAAALRSVEGALRRYSISDQAGGR